MSSEAKIVEAVATAAEDAVLAEYKQSDIADLDVTVRFEDGELTIDVYLDANADSPEDRKREEEVVDASIEAGERAADRLFEED